MKCKNIPAEFHRERVGVAASADARFTHNKIEEWIDNLDIHAYGRLCPKIVDAPPVLDLDFLSILSLKKRAVEHNSSLVPLMKEVRREETQDEDDFVTLINRPTPKPWVPLRELQEDTPYPIIAARELNWFVAASTELAIIPHYLEHHHLVYTPGSIIDYFCSDLDHHAIISQLITSLICQ